MTASAFTRALRAKYGSRKAVLRKLGIDEAVLSNEFGSGNTGGSGEKDAVKVLRGELEKMAGAWLESNKISDDQIKELYALMDEHAPPEARDQEGEEDDDREARLEKLRHFLGRKGFGEDDIQRACDAFVKGRSVGRDYAAGRPENNFQMGGSGRGSELRTLAGDADIARLVNRITHEPTFDDRRTRQVVGMDAAAVDELHRMFPGIEKIAIG